LLSPGELETLAAQQREAVITETSAWAQSLIRADLTQFSDEQLVSAALADLGLQPQSVELVSITAIDR
jgi:predicted ATPase